MATVTTMRHNRYKRLVPQIVLVAAALGAVGAAAGLAWHKLRPAHQTAAHATTPAAARSKTTTTAATTLHDDREAAPADDRSATADGYLGVLVAGESVDVAAKTAARVERVAVQPGDRVARGEELLLLERRPLQRELARARAALADARDRVRRRVPLGGAISREELSNARLQVLDKQGRVDDLLTRLADARIVAPFDGVVAARYIDPGALAEAGRPLLRLIGGGELRVRFAVPEKQAGNVAVGDAVHIRAGEAIVDGRVDRVAPEVDDAARVVFAVARLTAPASPHVRLQAGQIVRVAVAALSAPPAALAPPATRTAATESRR